MELKPLVTSANASNAKIFVRFIDGKYGIRVDFKNELVVCTNRAGDERLWVSLDTVLKHLNDAMFNGELILNITQQRELL